MKPRTVYPLGVALIVTLSSCSSQSTLPLAPSDPVATSHFAASAVQPAGAATRIFLGESLGGVLEFDANANGNVAPIASIHAPAIEHNVGITAVNGHLYVVTTAPGRSHFSTLAAFPSTTDDNPPPQNIASCRGMAGSSAVDVDVLGKAYVTNLGAPSADSISVFPANANGCVITRAAISGPHTMINGPLGIRIGSHGEIFVANANDGSIVVLPPHAVGDVAPQRFIKGPNTRTRFPTGIALDRNGNIYVSNRDNNSICIFAAGASGNAAPVRFIQGPNTNLHSPIGIAVDGAGQIYVANTGSVAAITVFSSTANGNSAPVRTIGGSNSRTAFQTGIAVQ